MEKRIRLGIVGYGNLGRGVESAVLQNPDMELAAVFTRRPTETVQIMSPGVPVAAFREISSWKNKVDVLALCGGSATDLPELTPMLAREFSLVDSFDDHGNIPEHYRRADRAAREGGNLAVISGGWDPGLFSLFRLWAEAVLPEGKTHTFWGPGVSQGHSEAVRRLPGVLDARQYTIPRMDDVEKARRGELPEGTSRERHRRCCYVAAEEGADREAIVKAIKTMPHYFAGYETEVKFVSREELEREHGGLPHGGTVIRSGTTGREKNLSVMELKLSLQSNPQFTGSIVAALARAAVKMARRGETGCRTVFDVAPADLSCRSCEELMKLL